MTRFRGAPNANSSGLWNLQTIDGPSLAPKVKFFYTSGSFVVPDGVNSLEVHLKGGGGSSGAGNGSASTASLNGVQFVEALGGLQLNRAVGNPAQGPNSGLGGTLSQGGGAGNRGAANKGGQDGVERIATVAAQKGDVFSCVVGAGGGSENGSGGSGYVYIVYFVKAYSPNAKYFTQTSSGVWTVPEGAKHAIFRAKGGGGSQASRSSGASNGGPTEISGPNGFSLFARGGSLGANAGQGANHTAAARPNSGDGGSLAGTRGRDAYSLAAGGANPGTRVVDSAEVKPGDQFSITIGGGGGGRAPGGSGIVEIEVYE